MLCPYMNQGRLSPDGIPSKVALVLGAGASRGVSYAGDCDISLLSMPIFSICCSGWEAVLTTKRQSNP